MANEDHDLIEQFRRKIAAIFQRRAIKDVGEWDGSASRWESTEAYCTDCLIDVNSAAGRDEKAQSHCMLPVRGPDDPDDTYVRQAAHAAAGGHGITQVKRPDDVPAEAWDKAVSDAAKKLVAIYDEMDEEAPESVQALAEGTERAKSINDIYMAAYAQLEEIDSTVWINDMFYDAESESLFIIVSSNGKLYQVPLERDGNSLKLGAWTEVEYNFKSVGDGVESRTIVRQTESGRYRWIGISATSVLNRVGQLDSRGLFDSFIAHAENTGKYPVRQFFHQGETFRTGQCDFLARDGFCLITSGLFDDTELGRLEAQARMREPDYWGDSIGFTSDDYEMWEVAEGVNIPVYLSGILREISTLPEEHAASWYTHANLQEVNRMLDDRVFEAFVKLFDGDEDKARAWLETNAEARNRAIEDANQLTRQKPPQANAQERDAGEANAPDADASESEPEATPNFEIDEEMMAALAAEVINRSAEQISEMVDVAVEQYTAAFEKITEATEAMAEHLRSLSEKVESLMQEEAEKRDAWLADRPPAPRMTITYRPRAKTQSAPPAEADDEPDDMSRRAEEVLSAIPKY